MNDYGELLDSNTVRFERLLPGPIERVWSYLVESEKRAQWLCALSHTWEFDGEASEVCYELEEVGDKVSLILTHRKLLSSEVVLSVSGGWHTHLDILVAILEHKKPKPFWKTQTAFAAEYEKRLGL